MQEVSRNAEIVARQQEVLHVRCLSKILDWGIAKDKGAGVIEQIQRPAVVGFTPTPNRWEFA